MASAMVGAVIAGNNRPADTATAFPSGNGAESAQTTPLALADGTADSLSAVLTDGSLPLTFHNDDTYPWTVEDGYIQNGNYNVRNSASEFSATFTIEKASKFSFDMYVHRSDNSTSSNTYHYLYFYINGKQYLSQNNQTDWGRTCVLLEPGTYTLNWVDTISNSSNTYYSQIRNMELSSDWLDVELASPGTLGVEVLYKVDVLTDVELLKVKGTLNSTDWTNLKQMSNLVGLDLSEASFDEVPEYAFDGLNYLSGVKLPEGMTSIGQYAFRNTQILNIEIPASVTSIGQYAFAGTRLAGITFAEGSRLTTIGYSAFRECSSLEEFIMPNTVTTLQTSSSSSYTFYNCTSLKKLHFSDALKTINQNTCYACTALEDLHLPDSLETINAYAFYNTTSLRKVDFPETLRTIEYNAFEYCGVDSVKLPVKLSSLGNNAFYRCTNLKYVELPSYIESYNYNFSNCTAIDKVVCRSATPPSVSNDPFNGLSKSNATLVVPSFAVVNYKLDTYWYQFGSIEEGDDIDYWKIAAALSLTNNRRMEGKPDVDLYFGGQFTVGGNAPMETAQFNIYINESNPGRLLNDCPDFTADSINTYYSVSANQWYFLTPLHDVDLSKVSHSADASYVFRYYDGDSRATNGTGNSWKNVEDGWLRAGQGYIFQCNAAGTLTLPAEAEAHAQVVNTEDVTTALATHEATSSANRSWNYVGNPYPAYYDVYYMDFTAPITVWTGSTYKAYSIVDDNFVLRPMQPFFVQKPDAVDNIVFHKEGRQLTSEVQRASYTKKLAAASSDRHIFNITISGDDGLTDETRVVVNADADNGYEIERDAAKFMSMEEGVPQIFTTDAQGNSYAINERPLADGRVAVGYSAGNAGFYTISATRADGTVTLTDGLLGKSVDLTSQDYTFYTNATAGTNLSRFSIVIGVNSSETTGIDSATDNNAVSVTGAAGRIDISAHHGASVAIYAADGRCAYRGSIDGTSSSIALPKGLYIVNVDGHVGKTFVY